MIDACIKALCAQWGIPIAQDDWRFRFAEALCRSGELPDKVVARANIFHAADYAKRTDQNVHKWADNPDNSTLFAKIVADCIAKGFSNEETLESLRVEVINATAKASRKQTASGGVRP
jgi:hypothetical protein